MTKVNAQDISPPKGGGSVRFPLASAPGRSSRNIHPTTPAQVERSQPRVPEPPALPPTRHSMPGTFPPAPLDREEDPITFYVLLGYGGFLAPILLAVYVLLNIKITASVQFERVTALTDPINHALNSPPVPFPPRPTRPPASSRGTLPDLGMDFDSPVLQLADGTTLELQSKATRWEPGLPVEQLDGHIYELAIRRREWWDPSIQMIGVVSLKDDDDNNQKPERNATQSASPPPPPPSPPPPATQKLSLSLASVVSSFLTMYFFILFLSVMALAVGVLVFVGMVCPLLLLLLLVYFVVLFLGEWFDFGDVRQVFVMVAPVFRYLLRII